MTRLPWKKIIASLIGVYLLYVFITAVVLFGFHYSGRTTAEPFNDESLEGVKNTDRVALVEDREDALISRIHLFENAEETIDISYYAMQGGDSVTIFFASLVEAADRGVHVRIMLDGMFHGMHRNRDIVYALSEHPHIDLRYYEPYDPMRPWTINNRLHDKFIVADQQFALIGGRNIGDKYFAPDGFEGASNDRDVLIINRSEENQLSAVDQIANYFQVLWEHEYTEPSVSMVSNRNARKGSDQLTFLREELKDWKKLKPDLFNQQIDWIRRSHPTNGVYFVHNPLQRWIKTPVVWQEITSLMKQAEQSILIQSPYLIPTEEMISYVDLNLDTGKITILTNSKAATPNLVAYSGYSNHRDAFAQSDLELYEYQGPDQSVHMKSLVIDEEITLVGSFNFDSRSTFLSTESMVVIDSPTFAAEVLYTVEESYLSNSLRVNSEGDYDDDDLAEHASWMKRTMVRLTSSIVRLFEFLL